jgi:DNA-binding NarL/FixJ family response regulator
MKLTSIEKQLLAMCMEGKGSSEIAFLLDKSVRTIESQTSNLKFKLGYDSKHQMVMCLRNLPKKLESLLEN